MNQKNNLRNSTLFLHGYIRDIHDKLQLCISEIILILAK